jgi:hypothetical protein
VHFFLFVDLPRVFWHRPISPFYFFLLKKEACAAAAAASGWSLENGGAQSFLRAVPSFVSPSTGDRNFFGGRRSFCFPSILAHFFFLCVETILETSHRGRKQDEKYSILLLPEKPCRQDNSDRVLKRFFWAFGGGCRVTMQEGRVVLKLGAPKVFTRGHPPSFSLANIFSFFITPFSSCIFGTLHVLFHILLPRVCHWWVHSFLFFF